MSDIFDHKYSSKSSQAKKVRRLSVPVSDNLQNAIAAYKTKYPDHSYTDTAVLVTMIDAGFKLWGATEMKKTSDEPVRTVEE